MKEDWNNIFGEVPASFEERMRTTLASLEEKPKIRHLRAPWRSLVAAVLIVALLGATAMATNLFGLKSLIVADPYATPEVTGDVIALQGLPESPEFKANAEWMAYLKEYNAGSRSTLTATAMDIDSDGYALYSADSAQSAAALDKIVKKYGLKLHTSSEDFFSEKSLYDKLGTAPFINNGTAVSGYIYEGGSFQGDGTNMAGKCYEYQLARYMKGTFSEVTLNVGDAEGYDEWIYTTASGVDVQLSMGPDRCVLLADLPSSFIAVNLLGGTRGNSIFMPEPVTKTDLEAFADFFDFSSLD